MLAWYSGGCASSVCREAVLACYAGSAGWLRSIYLISLLHMLDMLAGDAGSDG
jgi:hypothetical protein